MSSVLQIMWLHGAAWVLSDVPTVCVHQDACSCPAVHSLQSKHWALVEHWPLSQQAVPPQQSLPLMAQRMLHRWRSLLGRHHLLCCGPVRQQCLLYHK